MGLKFERSNDLDKLFDSFAVDPLKKEVPLEELAKQRQEVKKEEAKKQAEKAVYHEEKIIKSSCLSKFKAFLMTLSCLFHLPRGILSALVATIITGKS